MRHGYWVNHGREYTLIDERGAVIGVLRPRDDRIDARIKKAYYGPPKASERHAFGKVSETKENERNAV